MVAQNEKGRGDDPDPDSYVNDAHLIVATDYYESSRAHHSLSSSTTARIFLLAFLAWITAALTACDPSNPYVTREYLHVDRNGREVFSSRPLAPRARYVAVVTGVVHYGNYVDLTISYPQQLEGDALYLVDRWGNFNRLHGNVLFRPGPAALVQRDRGAHRYAWAIDGIGEKLSIQFDCHPDYWLSGDSDTLLVELYRSDIELSLWDQLVPDLCEFPLTVFEVVCVFGFVATLIAWSVHSANERLKAARRVQKTRERDAKERAREERRRPITEALRQVVELQQKADRNKREIEERQRHEAQQRQREEEQRRRAEAERQRQADAARRAQEEQDRRDQAEREKQRQAQKAAQEKRAKEEAERERQRREQAEREQRRIEEGRRQRIETLELLYGGPDRAHLEDPKWLEREAKRRRAAILADKATIEATYLALHKDPELIRQLKAINDGSIFRRTAHEMQLLRIAERLFGSQPPANGASTNGHPAASPTQQRAKAVLAELDDEMRAQDGLTKLLDKRGITDRQDRIRIMHEFNKRIAPQEEG